MFRSEKNEKDSQEKCLRATTDYCEEKKILDTSPVSHHADSTLNSPIVIPNDSGIYVNHGQFSDGPEVFKEITPFYVAASEPPTSFPRDPSPRDPSEPTLEVANSSDPLERIFRSRRKLFWVLIILTVVILGAAIGGGVGGGLARRKQSQRASQTVILTSSSAPSSTALVQSLSPSSNNSSPKPTATSNPSKRIGISMQIWENPNYQGRSQVFYTPGYYQTAFLARSYKWHPGLYTNDMEKCSMSFCNNDKELGWRGASFRDQPGFPDDRTWGADSIIIVCATNFASPGCPGPLESPTFSTVPIIEVSPSETLRSRSTMTASSITSK